MRFRDDDDGPAGAPSERPPEQSLGPDEVIRLDDLGIRYNILVQQSRTFKDYCIQWLRGGIQYQPHWALRGVSLTVGKGEILGVVGENGAGKSTLLKAISRIVPPSEGRVRVLGQVAPLVELGAGFHPDLTGRENIYLNALLLGYTRQQVTERLERITDFSELGDFLDAPVRTYSTGMTARLGFAIATDRSPDILIIDEILGVGDDRFYDKCEQRIASLCTGGTTVLFVSHSLAKIESMCDRAAWLHQGRLMMTGEPRLVTQAYRERNRTPESALRAAGPAAAPREDLGVRFG
jgi:ABC-2 type transport system ATP-binding protein